MWTGPGDIYTLLEDMGLGIKNGLVLTMGVTLV